MGIESAKRVVMRLREKYGDHINEKQLRNAIMKEVGTDDRTLLKYKNILIELKWIKRKCRYTYDLDTKDITGDMF